MDADVQPILTAAKIFHANNPNTAISNLVAPELKATPEQDACFARWLHEKLGLDVKID
jgi:pyruvate-formate lyase-activating enzyme